jgi:hypothetical protein
VHPRPSVEGTAFVLMSPKRPGIKHSQVTKLLRNVGEQAEAEQRQEKEELAVHHQHEWHRSFDTLTSHADLSTALSTEPSVQQKAPTTISSTGSLKQPVPQASAVEILSWIAQFQAADPVFCSGTKLWQYEGDIFGPGVSFYVSYCLIMLECDLKGSCLLVLYSCVGRGKISAKLTSHRTGEGTGAHSPLNRASLEDVEGESFSAGQLCRRRHRMLHVS